VLLAGVAVALCVMATFTAAMRRRRRLEPFEVLATQRIVALALEAHQAMLRQAIQRELERG
jgi:putative copper export protein